MAKRKGGNLPAPDLTEQQEMLFGTQEAITVQEVMRKIGLTAFNIDFMKSPEDALSSYRLIGKGDLEGQELNSKMLEVWERLHFERIMNDVIEQTGADPEQLRDPKKRTPEQQQALLKASAREQAIRMRIFFESKYFQALKALDSIEGKYHSKHDGDSDYIDLKEQAILYYFASHDDIAPTDTDPLTDAQKMELIDLFYRLDKFYLEEAAQDKDDESPEPIVLYRFIEAENPNTNLPVIITEKMQEQKKEIITVLQTVIPKYHIIPNTALSNYLTSGDLSKPFDLKVINKKGKQKEITNFTIVSYDPNSNVAKVAENMTEYERGVYNAICSVYKEAIENGQPPIFTTDILYRAMPGSGDKPSSQKKGAITKAIEKHRLTYIDSDITEELKAKKLIPDDVEEVKLNDFILSVKAVKVRMKNGGQQVTAYMINSIPLLLEYGQLTNNLITVSRKWLDIKQVKNGKPTQFALLMTQERQAMTGYLIRRIKIMQNDKKNKKPTQSNTILFATLFDAIGQKNPSRDKALNTRKSCYAILDYYKAEKIITDYEEQRKGRSVTGVKIIL